MGSGGVQDWLDLGLLDMQLSTAQYREERLVLQLREVALSPLRALPGHLCQLPQPEYASATELLLHPQQPLCL